jgi:hypothetical protein
VSTIRVSASVMAHPKRSAWALGLADKLDLAADRITWDRCNDIWDTARRAWLSFSPEATHHMVIQDDAVPCRDLISALEGALVYPPAESIASLYVGTRRPMTHEVTRLVQRAREDDASWLVLEALCWGVAVVVPTEIIPEMVAWCDQHNSRGDDVRIRRFVQTQLHWQVWHPWPSLVDHRDEASLIGHGPGRKAHQFVGSDVSALDVDWSKSVVRRETAPRSRTLRVAKGVLKDGTRSVH